MKEIDFTMIKLDLKDLLRKKIYIVRYGGKQYFKTSNLNTLKRLIKAIKPTQAKNSFIDFPYLYLIYKYDILLFA